MTQDPLPPVAVLNRLSLSAFADAVGLLFEDAPRFLARLGAARPFASDDDLLAAASRLVGALPQPEAIELADAHPRIGADPAGMSAASRREQGETASSSEATVAERLAALNARYEARFGFRFVVFVAGRPRAAMVPLLEAALTAQRDVELRRAVQDCVAIAADRLRRLRFEEVR